MEQLKQEAQRQQERLDDRGLDRQAREDASKRHDATLRSIAALNADVRKDVANISANKTKPLSDKARADLDAAEAQMRGLEQASESLKTASDKGVGYLPGLVQSYLPGGTALVNMVRDKPTKDAIQQLTYVSGEIQHGRFGASLTKGEKADAAQYLPEPYDSKAELQRKATGLQNLLDLSNRRLRERGESEGGATGTWSAPPAKAGTGQRRKWNPATGKLE